MSHMTKVSQSDKDALRAYLETQAYGRERAKKKKDVVDALGRGWRYLCQVARALNRDGIPVGTCDDGWFLVAHQEELLEINRREYSRGMKVLDMLAERRKAFYTYHKIKVERVDLEQTELPV